jgi:predicted ester cyclase
MATTADIARRYFAALSAHDLDAALACWAPGAIDRFVGGRDLVAPEGVREYFGSLFEAFPDFTLEVVELTTYRGRTAVRWRARGTFAGPGRFMDFLPNGARLELEGCDVVSVEGDLIRHNDAYLDTGDIARPARRPAAGRLNRGGAADTAGQYAHSGPGDDSRRRTGADRRRRLGAAGRLSAQDDERLPDRGR